MTYSKGDKVTGPEGIELTVAHQNEGSRVVQVEAAEDARAFYNEDELKAVKGRGRRAPKSKPTNLPPFNVTAAVEGQEPYTLQVFASDAVAAVEVFRDAIAADEAFDEAEATALLAVEPTVEVVE